MKKLAFLSVVLLCCTITASAGTDIARGKKICPLGGFAYGVTQTDLDGLVDGDEVNACLIANNNGGVLEVQKFYIDLGKTLPFHEIKINWEGAKSTSYKIYATDSDPEQLDLGGVMTLSL